MLPRHGANARAKLLTRVFALDFLIKMIKLMSTRTRKQFRTNMLWSVGIVGYSLAYILSIAITRQSFENMRGGIEVPCPRR